MFCVTNQTKPNQKNRICILINSLLASRHRNFVDLQIHRTNQAKIIAEHSSFSYIRWCGVSICSEKSDASSNEIFESMQFRFRPWWPDYLFRTGWSRNNQPDAKEHHGRFMLAESTLPLLLLEGYREIWHGEQTSKSLLFKQGNYDLDKMSVKIILKSEKRGIFYNKKSTRDTLKTTTHFFSIPSIPF